MNKRKEESREAVIIGELDCSKIDRSFFDALLAVLEEEITESPKNPP